MLTEAARAIHSATWASPPDEHWVPDQTSVLRDSALVPSIGVQSLAVSPASASMQRDILEHAWRLFFERADITSCSPQATHSLFPSLLDSTYLENDRQERARLESELWMSFDADPLEDGLHHPAEETISGALQSADGVRALEWFKALTLDTEYPDFAASVLRCLGRQERPGTIVWRVEIVRAALGKDNVEVRDAAAQAAESWGGSDMRDVLQAHSEPEPWLRDYIEDIVGDLAE